MTVFEINDNGAVKSRLLGYLFYYERSRRFFTELLSNCDEWDAPFIFSGFVRNGRYSIGSEWSHRFVAQRIIPTDRQNLGAILKENGLKEYDEYKLLLLSTGRCAQDELHLVRIDEAKIVPEIRSRLERKVRDCIPLSGNKVLVFFRDGKSVIADIAKYVDDDRSYARILREKEVFDSVRVAPGGNGIEWGSERTIPAESLYDHGKSTDIAFEDMLSFASNRLADTAEACEMLSCSRQYINQLTREERLTPVRTGNNNLFFKSDLETK